MVTVNILMVVETPRIACSVVSVLAILLLIIPMAQGSIGNLVVKTLIYEGVIELSLMGKSIKDVIGLNISSPVSLSITYKVEENISFTHPELTPYACSIHIYIVSVTGSTQLPENWIKKLGSWSNSIELQGDECINPPLVLFIRNGEIALDNISKTGTMTGITRLDVDTVHLVGGNPFLTLNHTIYSSFWSLYYEPLSGIVIYYTQVYNNRSPEGDVFFYSLTLMLNNYQDIFYDIVKREVIDLRPLNSPTTPSIILVYLNSLGNSNDIPRINSTNNSITILFDEPTYCFIEAGPFDPLVNISSNIELFRYSTINGLTIYYSMKTPCKILWFNLSNPMNTGGSPVASEKGVPPKYIQPGMDSIIFTIMTVSAVLYIVYSVINWLIKEYYDVIFPALNHASNYTCIQTMGSCRPCTYHL
ncbi:hypothetical protein [Desulfurococcus amylolyticus]|uniref:hypothetical protein n=1 Tax=Desulfurococcus amylolyticus TaxID=94694 RepID=UPI0012FF288F|nr:hypothetical protein [Desulfurococcus amylolyticus]